MQCIYRSQQFKCKLAERANPDCGKCLAGQQIDSIERLARAVMDLHIDALEEEISQKHG